MKNILFIFCAALFIFIGCSKDHKLDKSVFISDTEFTDLPAYSEWGYNTFGAYYDRTPFISNNSILPAKVSIHNNSMSFDLDGQKEFVNSYGYSEMVITFKMEGITPADYTGLLQFNGTVHDLTKSGTLVLVTVNNIQDTAVILNGELKFKRAQNLLVDKQQIEVILSGTFGFRALINDKPITISEGRFDVGISPDNFYSY